MPAGTSYALGRFRGSGGDDDPGRTLRDATALMTERSTHSTPYVFIGLPSTVCGPRDDVLLPDIGQQHDWELELGVVQHNRCVRP